MAQVKRQWRLISSDDHLVETFSRELETSSILARILVQRGLRDPALASHFLNPSLQDLTSPWDIPGMKEAAGRIRQAVSAGRKILIYGDYDVDGLTATAALYSFLIKLGAGVGYYIPHRHEEGYGLNARTIDWAAKEGYGLLITVDCGISNFEEIELAGRLGLEVVVTDHHNIPRRLPAAICVDPKFLSPEHPAYGLAGVGVAFKLIWALAAQLGQPADQLAAEYLDLVALGTVADVVPLLGDNRILVTFGLMVLAQGRRPGLTALARSAGLKGPPGVTDIGYVLGPRLNAAGRLEHADISLKLLLTADADEAYRLAQRLNGLNGRRQSSGRAIKETIDHWLARHEWTRDKILVLAGRDWHPGVIGIVAGQIADEYARPTVLISVSGQLARGSTRGVEGVDVFQLLDGCRELLTKFGGHKQAAGFTLPAGDVTALREKLTRLAGENLTWDDLVPFFNIEAEIGLADITGELWREIKCLMPFGEGNEPPLFLCRKALVTELRPLAAGRHYRLRLGDGSPGLAGIAFRQAPPAGQLIGETVDLVCNLAEDNYERPGELVFQIKDLCLSGRRNLQRQPVK